MNTHFIIGLLCLTFVMLATGKPSEDPTGAAAGSIARAGNTAAGSAAGVVEKDLDGLVDQAEKAGDSLLHVGSDLLKANPLRGILGNLFSAGAVAGSRS